MAIKYGMKKSKQNNILYTIITAILICTVFIGMVTNLYTRTQEEEYESLHVQTKQIKDNLTLQIKSDSENLYTMASFASRLYQSGRDYAIMFDSFKPIGLFSRIGIMTPDGQFITKGETIDLSGKISFAKEAKLGAYITGRTYSYSIPDQQVVRSGVPIVADGKTVGIIYGIINVETLNERYKEMADELGGQLFVYEKGTGDIIIDTIQDQLGNISFLQDRSYNDGSSYEEFISTDKGNVSFKSAFRDENLHMHYSTMEDLGWMIAFGKYDSQVFAETHTMAGITVFSFVLMLSLIIIYMLVLFANEKRLKAVTECASNVRKELLETVGDQNNIQDALIEVCKFAKSRSAVFFNTDGEFFHYIDPRYHGVMLSDEERQYLATIIFRYATELCNNNNNRAVSVMCIKADRHMQEINPEFYSFLTEHSIREISLSATINKANSITILAAINSKRGKMVRMLAEKVSACFSMALYNKNHLNRTIKAATTDPLTGVLNRVAFKSDLVVYNEEKAFNFACLYIDVNELHICNNKYGHGAGDEMLMYIANTLKEVFYGHKIYRMGGDEFLVFCQNVEQETMNKGIKVFQKQLVPRGYHVALGMSYRTQNTCTEDMVREAEVRMYEAKAEYYQNKEHKDLGAGSGEYVQAKTGILEIDTILSILKEKYNGIYRVSLASDKARRILMPAYLNYNENEEHFSKLFTKYVSDSVDPDYHRSVLNFLNYDTLANQLLSGKTPKITFKKNDGELVALSVYKLEESMDSAKDTLWVFAKV